MPLPKKVSELTSELAEYADLEIVWIAHEEGLLDENYKLLKQYLRYHEVVLTYTVTVEGIQASGEVVINVGITKVKNTIYIGGNYYQQTGGGDVAGDVLCQLSKFDSPRGVLPGAAKTWGYSYSKGQFNGYTWYIDKTDEIIINGTNFENIFTNEYAEINTFTGSFVKTGTLNTQTNSVYSIRLSNALQDLLDNRNITYKSSSRVITTVSIKTLLEELITFNSTNTEIIYEVLNSTNNWFTITASITDSYASNIVHEYVTNFELTGFYIGDYFEEISANKITLDKDEIIL